eukprot:TRINITY_DN2370_c0_g1_i1.p1 TRINITY_DN2370_c0_g1~~TRINITY_DN2370_c0_g1_i1.p1  ORF type:complete len:306 (+),score=137.06 TRINITY_DN2370_c0_g1_i1:27-920(+)
MATINETLVEFPVFAKTASGQLVNSSDLTISVEGPQEVTPRVLPHTSSEFLISFTTVKLGDYTIYLSTNKGEKLSQYPINVTVKEKGDEGQDEEPIPANRNVPDFGANGPAKNLVRFEVEAKNQNGLPLDPNDLSPSSFHGIIQGPEDVSTLNIQVTESNTLLVSFETTVLSGEFTVTIKHRGAPIYRTPFSVSLSPSSKSENDGSDIARLEPEDESKIIQFTVPAKLKNGDRVDASKLTVSIEDGPDKAWEPKVENSSDDPSSLLVSFKTLTLGKYVVSVLHQGNHIAGSPFTLAM